VFQAEPGFHILAALIQGTERRFLNEAETAFILPEDQ